MPKPGEIQPGTGLTTTRLSHEVSVKPSAVTGCPPLRRSPLWGNQAGVHRLMDAILHRRGYAGDGDCPGEAAADGGAGCDAAALRAFPAEVRGVIVAGAEGHRARRRAVHELHAYGRDREVLCLEDRICSEAGAVRGGCVARHDAGAEVESGQSFMMRMLQRSTAGDTHGRHSLCWRRVRASRSGRQRHSQRSARC